MSSSAASASASAALTPDEVSLELVADVARNGLRVNLADGVADRMRASAEAVARFDASQDPAYGVTTGFGSLACVTIPAERRAELQRALVRSHAAGMGDPIERECVRAMMLLRARSLSMGYSGVRPALVE